MPISHVPNIQVSARAKAVRESPRVFNGANRGSRREEQLSAPQQMEQRKGRQPGEPESQSSRY